ncbi:hypothetical protein ACH4VT_33575 [Streptomyces lydicus]|uniref:hypothetical protein n=1 Tax=Streptomyces lydicus TaxID=47763 RepID=UPI003793BB6E
MLKSTLGRAAAAGTLALAALGGTVALAGPASAVGSSACTSSYVSNGGQLVPSVQTLTRAGALNFRTGPGTGYSSRGSLYQDGFWATCSAKGYSWIYGKVLSGSHRGQWGWVARQYTGLA